MPPTTPINPTITSTSAPFPRGLPFTSGKSKIRKVPTCSIEQTSETLTQPPTKRKKPNPINSNPTSQTLQKFNPFTAFTQKNVVVGIVKYIHQLDVAVALPNNKFGFVSITEISPIVSEKLAKFAEDSDNEDDSEASVPKLTQLFTQGQLILVKVIQISVNDKSKSTRISLTAQPSQLTDSMSLTALTPGMLVQGYIKSEQDHGYLIDLGFSSTESANTPVFLPSSSLPKDLPYTLVTGLVSLFRVHSILGRTITVNLIPPSTNFESLPPSSFWPSHYVATPFVPDLTANAQPAAPIAVGEIVRGTVIEHCLNGSMKVGLVLPGDKESKKPKHKQNNDDALPPKFQFIGKVQSYHISDINLSHPEKRFPEGSTHKFRVLHVNGHQFSLTAKKTLLSSDLPLITDYIRENVDSLGHGTIVSVREDGCVVQFFNYVHAFVPIREMAHEFLTSTADFRCGQPVKCRIFYANAEQERMSASFVLDRKKGKDGTDTVLAKVKGDDHDTKNADVQKTQPKNGRKTNGDSKDNKPKKLRKSEQIIRKLDFEKLMNTTEIHSADDVTVGSMVNGYVINIKDCAGVFVALSPKVIARIKIGALSDDFVKDWKVVVTHGEMVTCRVVFNENGQIELTRKSLGKKGRRTKAEDCNSSKQVVGSVSHEVEGIVADSESDSDDDQDGEHQDDESLESDDSDDTSKVEQGPDNSQVPISNGIKVVKPFDWSATLSDDTESDDDEEEHEPTVSSHGSALNSASQNGKPKLDEQTIMRREATLLDEPQLATDYERLLVSTPNSSYLWIQYMAFQLKLADIEKARAIAERAVQTIHYREEKEKLNVWVAYMNLEHQYGDTASLEILFKRAVQYNDPMTVYQHLASMYARSDMHERASETYEEMVRKDKQTPQTWIQYGMYLYSRPETHGQARDLLQRALSSTSVPKSKHIELIMQFAILEFKHADVERARTIFEGILANYPKRVDIWSVYLDQQIRVNDMDAVRLLFDRIITLKFSAKKMKFFFKKYLEFEKKVGDVHRVAYVKKKAVEYVESLSV